MKLSCVDAASPSKLLVTTRIRGLLNGCAEVSLNLLAPAEAADLLLRTGAVDDADAAAMAAPSFAKAHLRLLAALAKLPGATLEQQRGAALRGVGSCPDCGELRREQKNLASLAVQEEAAATGAAAAAAEVDILAAARQAAAQPDHPQYAAACSDLGAAYACGAVCAHVLRAVPTPPPTAPSPLLQPG